MDSIRDIFKSDTNTCLKRQVYDWYVLPAMAYGADTWALTTQAKNKLAAAKKVNGKEYAKHRIPGQKNKHLGERKDKGYRRDWTTQKTEVDLGRARQQDTR